MRLDDDEDEQDPLTFATSVNVGANRFFHKFSVFSVYNMINIVFHWFQVNTFSQVAYYMFTRTWKCLCLSVTSC